MLRDAFPAEHYHRGVGLKGFEQTGARGGRRISATAAASRPIC